MEPYLLKDKISISTEFLSNLESKGWQEIETIQNQLTNIEASADNAPVIQLLNNLLTSYYVFVGGIENLACNNKTQITSVGKAPEAAAPEIKPETTSVKPVALPDYHAQVAPETVAFEPFEYFVDFDEPSGEPLSDEDLYGN